VARAATTTDPFNAIAEPRRREIIYAFAGGPEQAVGELVTRLRIAQQAAHREATRRDEPMKSSQTLPSGQKVVSKDEWLKARIALLAKEKALTHEHDKLARERRELPCVKVETAYTFDGPRGKLSLADLFDGRNQLVVYHFMLGPDWPEGCPSCSFLIDHLDGATVHLKARDVTMVLVSRAPLAKIEAFKKRMGWHFPWVSSHGSDFNSDFDVSFTKEQIADGRGRYNFGTIAPYGEECPGLSVFAKDAAGQVFHTYSAYARGLEPLLGTYVILDLVPKGRDEEGLPSTMSWVKHHDKYAEPVPLSASSFRAKDAQQ
jgi:predicted dithiol-disulfide oxidoreductase (DUF899 family)